MVLLSKAQAALQLDLEVVLDHLLELVKRCVDTQAGEIVAMNDARQPELCVLETARRGFPTGEPHGDESLAEDTLPDAACVVLAIHAYVEATEHVFAKPHLWWWSYTKKSADPAIELGLADVEEAKLQHCTISRPLGRPL